MFCHLNYQQHLWFQGATQGQLLLLTTACAVSLWEEIQPMQFMSPWHHITSWARRIYTACLSLWVLPEKTCSLWITLAGLKLPEQQHIFLLWLSCPSGGKTIIVFFYNFCCCGCTHTKTEALLKLDQIKSISSELLLFFDMNVSTRIMASKGRKNELWGKAMPYASC